MKKMLCLIALLTALCLLLGACDLFEEQRSTASVKKKSSTKATTEAALEETDPTEAETEPTQGEEASGVTYAGQVNGGEYENAYFGFSFLPAHGWVFYSRDELAALNNFADDLSQEMGIEAYSQRIEEGGSVFVAGACDEQGNNISFCVQKTNPLVKAMDEGKRYELFKQSMEQQVAQAGISGYKVVVSSTKMGTEEVRCLRGNLMGMDQISIYLVDAGYSCLITITGTTISADEIAAMFHR